MNRTGKSALAIAITIGIGFPVWKYGIAVEEEPPAAPPRELGPVPVRVVPVEAQALAIEVEAYGNLLPAHRVVVSAEVTARIRSVHPDWRPGAAFAAGDVLVDLDEATLRLALDTAVAAVAEAEAAERGAQVEEDRAKVSLASVTEQTALATRENERVAALLVRGATSETIADQALRAKLDADLAVETAASAVASAKVAVDRAGAALTTARARRAEVEDRLAKSTIRAPFDGRFVGRAPTVGSLAAMGAPLGEVVDAGPRILSARVPEHDLLRLRVGMEARLRFPSTPELVDAGHARGTVRALDAATDVATRRGTVEIDVHEVDVNGRGVDLPVGLFAAATIVVDELEGAIWIDRRHLVWRGAEAVCFVFEEGAARMRPLRFSGEYGEGFLVESGLDAGDVLITGPLDRLEDGRACRLPEPEPEPEPEPADGDDT